MNDGSKAIVKKPRSAISWAYRPAACSFTAPNGPHTAMAGNLPSADFGRYMSAASVIPYRFTNRTLLWSTLSLLGKVLSHSFVRVKFSIMFLLSGLEAAKSTFPTEKANRQVANRSLMFIYYVLYEIRQCFVRPQKSLSHAFVRISPTLQIYENCLTA